MVMGAAFGTVVSGFVKDLLTPLIAALVGKPDFSALKFTINGSQFQFGDFINAAISFVLVGGCLLLCCSSCERPYDSRQKGAPGRPDIEKVPGV